MYANRRYNRTPTNRTQSINRQYPTNNIPQNNNVNITTTFLEYKRMTDNSISEMLNNIKNIETKFTIDNAALKIFKLQEKVAYLEQTINNISSQTNTLGQKTSKLEEDKVLACHDNYNSKLNNLETLFSTFVEDYTIRYSELLESHTIYKSKIEDILSKETTHSSAILEEVATLNKTKTNNIILLLEQLVNQNKEHSTITSLLVQRLEADEDDNSVVEEVEVSVVEDDNSVVEEVKVSVVEDDNSVVEEVKVAEDAVVKVAEDAVVKVAEEPTRSAHVPVKTDDNHLKNTYNLMNMLEKKPKKRKYIKKTVMP